MKVLRTILIVLFAQVLMFLPVLGQTLNNYTFSSSTGTFTPLTGATVANIGIGSLDEGTFENIPVGFDFYYMGSRYSTVSMCTNGYLTLTNPGIVNPTASGGSSSAINLSTVAQRPVLAPYLRDMVMDLGVAGYQTTGSVGSRVFTAEWLQARLFASATVRVPFISIQVKLYEGTGIIEFLYRTENGPLFNPNSPTAQVSVIGINGPVSGQYLMLDGTGASPNALYNVQTPGVFDRPATNQLYRFTPIQNTVAPPVNLAFSNVTGTSMSITWQNNATNAVGFGIFRSDDGGSSYMYVGSASVSSPSYTAENLNSNKTYFWRVYAMSEGVISAPLSGSQSTSTGSRTATSSGNWSSTGTWSGGVVPTATDNVTVPSGITVTIDNAAATANTIDVSGTVEFAATGNNTLSVMQNVIINATGTVRTSASGTSSGNTLNIGSNQRTEGGNLTNNGTLDLHNNAGSSAAALVFMGVGNSTFGGSGSATDVFTITLNKGTSPHLTTMNYALMPILQLNPSAFTVRSSAGTDATGFLTLTSGILRISGSYTYSSTVFTSAAYTINNTSGIWLDNANFTVSGQNGSPTSNGYFRVTNGTYNIGTSSGNTMQFASTSTSISGTPAATVTSPAYINVEGGSINVAGRFQVTGGTVNYNQSGGTITVATVGNSASSVGSFDLGTATTSSCMITGGTIVVQTASTGGTPLDVRGLPYSQANNLGEPTATTTTVNHMITGGSVVLGNASTGAAANFRLAGILPSTTISSTSAIHNATISANTLIRGTLNHTGAGTMTLGSFALGVTGDYTNNAAINGVSGILVFQGSAQQTFGGSGSITSSQISTLVVQNSSGANPAVVNNFAINVTTALNLLQGSIGGSGTLTLGTGGTFTTSRGSGSLVNAPTFNATTYNLTYTPPLAGGNITTGNEVPSGGVLGTLTVNNAVSNTVLGTALNPTSFVLTNGIVVTTATNLLTVTGTAASNLTFTVPTALPQLIPTYVNGPLARRIPGGITLGAVNTYTFPVGKTGFNAFEVVNPTTTAAAAQFVTVQAEAFDGNSGGSAGSEMTSINTNRYWNTSVNTGGGAAFVSTRGLSVRLWEINSTPVNCIGTSSTQTGAYSSIGGSTTNTLNLLSSVISTPANLGYLVLGTKGGPGGPIAVGPSASYSGYSIVYPTLSAAATDVTAKYTLTSNILVEMQSDYTSASEVYPITFGAMPFTSTTNTVTVRPASNVPTPLTISASNTNPLVDFNGAYRVVIDGRSGGAGTSRNIVFDQQSTAASTVRFQNDAIENTMRYCVVRGGNTTTPSASTGLNCGIVQFGTTVGLLGNNNNTISNCLIREATATAFNPTCGVFSAGNTTAGRGNLANNILNNEIANIFNTSITTTAFVHISSGCSDWNISGNSLYLTSTVPGGGASPRVYSTTNSSFGILVSNTGGNGFTVNNNFIGGSQAQCGGAPWTIGSVAQTTTTPANNANVFAACSLAVGQSSNTNFQGNKISNFACASTTTFTWSGLLMTSGNLNCLNNTFGGATSLTSPDTIAVASSGSTVTMFGVQHTSGTTVVYSNNTFNALRSYEYLANTASNIRGISIAGGTNIFVQGNTIGSSNAALGLLAVANPSGASITADVTGILQSSSSNFFVKNNIINNLNYVVPSGLTIATAIQTRGIFAQSGFLTVTGNTVSNLINSALNNNTGNSSPTTTAVIGISATSTSSSTTPGTLHIVTQNTVSNLSATSTVAGSQNVIGLNIGSLNSISPYNVSRNIIHSLSASTNSTTTTPNIVGINIAGGSHQVPNYHSITNNFVRLGLDANGTSIANNLYFHGIWKSSTSSSCSTNVAHNTIYIGGVMNSAVSGTGNNYGYRRMTATTTMNDTVMNNIFVNVRSTQSGSTGTGNYFAVALSQTPTSGRFLGLTMNYNLLLASSGSIGQSGATNYTDIVAWRGAGNVDINSISSNPNFVNPTGTAATFNLRVQNPTPIERAGKILSSVANDFDNNVRANLSPADIGAQAGSFTLQSDITPPEITFTPLSSPISTTTPRTITVNITDDISGVPTTGVGLPRLYWKIRFNGTVTPVQGTYIGGGQYTFTMGSGVATGDTVYYYVAAQDNAATPNVGLSTWNGVTAVTSNPPAPNAEPTRTFQSFYAIAGTCLSGEYTVGTSGNYTTLSSALSALTNGVICSDVTLTIISDLLTENSNASIVFPNYGGASSPYKITIRPNPNGTAPFTIRSTSSSYLILFNGARNITIDGRMGSIRQGLIFENLNTNGWVFYFLNDASGDTVRNCLIKGAYSSSIGTIYIASTSATTASWGGAYGGVTGNDNIMIDSCDIFDAGTGTTLPTTAIYSQGSTSTLQQANSGIVITNNNIYNYFFANSSPSAAIYATSGSLGWTITGNNIYQTAPRTHTAGVQYHGIYVNNSFNGSGFIITNNNIGGRAPNCAGAACTYNGSTLTHNFTPIQYTGDNTASSTISGNKIANIAVNSANSNASGAGMFTGIFIGSGNATVQNNTIGGNNASDTINLQQSTSATSLTWANGIYSQSSGSVNILSNLIGGDKANTFNFQSAFTSGGFTFAGVMLQGSNNVSITGNTIGSASVANSIVVNNSTTFGGSQNVAGVLCQQSGSINITNNTIANLTNNSNVSSAQIRGIATTSGINTINNNTVRNLSTASTSSSTTTSSAIVGIDMTSSVVGSAGQAVNNNTIHSLISTTTSVVGVNIIGINYSFNVSAGTGQLATHSISGNNIHSLSIASANTSTATSIIGIHYAAGHNLTMANNMIRLGINADGTNITSGCTITGIWKNNVIYTATYNSIALPMFNKFFHNSVYIGGSGVAGISSIGALNTFAFRRNGIAYFNGAIDSVYNNVFVNARSNTDASQTVRHWVQYYDDIQNLSQNYNDLQQTGTGGGLIVRGITLTSPIEYTSIPSWRTLAGSDAHSFSANPNFSNPTGNASAVSLQISTSGTTPVEGAGVNIATVTTDQKGTTRSSNTPTDIGADAGNFSINDVTPPTIIYTPLSTPIGSTAARTLTVTITDASGVPTTGSGLPRLYWRSGTGGSYNSITGTSIGSGQYTFSNIGAGSTAGATIFYYVVAQDNASTPNVTSNPIINAGGFTATPPVAGSAPVPNSYQILGTLCGTITVGGAGANYTTLKDAFDAINNSTLTCNLLVNITGNTTETLTPVLNEINYNGGPYTITIVPSGGARSITGSNTATIDFNGSDRIIIDGRIDGTGTPKSLTIENNSGNGIAVRFINGAQFNTVKNCVIRGANTTGLTSTTNPGAVVVFGSTNTTVGNSDNTISGCDIRESSNGQTPWYCVNSTNTLTSPSLYNSRDTLLNNNIFNYFNGASAGNFAAGLIVNDGNADWTIDGNSLYQTATRNILLVSANIIQFRVIMANAGSGTFNIRNNYIGGSAPQCGGSAMTMNALQGASLTQVMGVQVPLPGNAIINNNKIANIVFNSAASGFVFTGLTLFAGNATITNNTIGGHTQPSDSIVVTTAPTSVNLVGQTIGIQIQTGTNTNPVQIQNNTIANIRGTNLVTVSTNNPANYGMGIMGINLTSALTSGIYTITGNTIGSTTVANSIVSMNPSISSSAQFVYGIRSTSSGRVTINNNTVANLTNAAFGNTTNTSYGSLSHQTAGIYVTSGLNTINNNTVFNLSCASTQAGLGGAATVIGIMQSPSSTVHATAPQVVNGNTVHSLFSTATSGTPSVVGIFNWSPNAGINSVSKNTVHSLSVASGNPASTIYGIHMNAGIATVANNAIRLGIDAFGNPLTVGYNIAGILKQPLTIAGGITAQVPNNMDFLHNSVYIGGSNVAENGIGQGSNTFAFQKNMPGNDILLNNMFINARSNSTGVGKHYSASADATAGLIMDYNLVQAIGTGGVLFGTGIPTVNTDYTTLAAWRQSTLLDVNSATGVAANIANFVNPTGTAGTVNMHVQSATPAEASGVDVVTVLQGSGRPYLWDDQDVDGSTRSSLTPNDIGADAGNFTAADIFPPAISYSPFTNSSTTATRTVVGIAITDASGVNITSGTRPRIYYKRNQDVNTINDNTSATDGWKWVEASNTTSPFSFTIDYSKINGGTVSVGDNIQYVVTAQDLATTPNVAINSGIFTTAPSTVNLSSANTPIIGTINNYAIVPSVSGTINVGAGQTYSSLTNSGGLFQMLNNVGMISGNVIVNVTSDLAEDGTFSLNQLTEEGTGGYTIRIQPVDNAERSISGRFFGGLIRLNGADRVVFDGRFNGSGRFLNITNTATSNFNGITTFGIAAIQLISQGVGAGCVRDTIRNCKISTGNNQIFSFGIYGGSLVIPASISGTGPDNNSIAIMNNIITNAQVGVYMRGVAPSSVLNGLNISNNQFGTSNNTTTITTRAIDIESCNGALLSGNDIVNINSPLTTNTSGIEVGQWTTNARIIGNSICGVSNQIQLGVLTCGVRVNTTAGTSAITIANNFINGVTAYGVNTLTGNNPYGIRIEGGINFNIVHNTIVMDGSFSNPGVSSSAALQMTSTSSAGFIVRNNIFINTMSGGTGTKCYAVYVPNTTLPFTMGTFNNNDYFVGSNNFTGFFLGDVPTVGAWQSSTGQDAASVSVNPVFAGANCRALYLGVTEPQLVGSSAVSTIVNTDIDGLSRSKYYMGADEITPTFQFTSTPQSQSLCVGGNVTLNGTATVTFDDGVTRSQMSPTYRWTKNSSTISGATNNTYAITNAVSTDAGTYNVTAKFGQSDSLVSANAVVTIGTPVSIVTQPTAPSALCVGGGGFTLTVTAGGTVLGYQWQKDTQRNGTWTSISGATTNSYAVGSVAGADSGKYRCVITGSASCTPPSVITDEIDVVVRIPVSISIQPITPSNVCVGNSLSLLVTSSGTITSYQWQQDRLRNNTWVNVGINAPNFNVLTTTLADSGNYRVVITGSCNTVTSQISNVFINTPATITTQPTAPAPLCIGTSFTLSVGTNGTVSGIQWQKSPVGQNTFTNIVGATLTDYTVVSASVSDNADYRAVISGPCTSPNLNSSVVRVVVNSPFSITTQPSWNPSSACTGLSTTISVATTGTVATYQWQKFNGSIWNSISGATNTSYNIASLVLADSGQYRVQITGPCSALTTSNIATLTVQQNVQVTGQPSSQTVCTGSPISLSITTLGTVVSYQWQQDVNRNGTWVSITGATNSSYSKSNVTTADSGDYRIQVVGTCSATPVVSSTATVTVQQPFGIVTQPTWPSSPTNVGQVVTLTVGYVGTASFQWQRDQQRNNNWVNVGSNSNVYSYTVNTIADSGNFRCTLTGPCNTGSQTTNTASVFTCQPPSITLQPFQPNPTCPGETLTLSTQAVSVGQTIFYQWQQDVNRNGSWVNITGATNSTYSKSNIQASDDGRYRAQITSSCSVTPISTNAVDVVVRVPITITSQPTSQIVCVNSNVTFSVTATGTTPSYQWFFNGSPISSGVNATAVTSTLQLSNVTSGNAGTYSCFVSSPCSPNGVTSNNVTLTVNSSVVITQQPQNITGCTGTPISFTVNAIGTALGYQWRFNSTNISGATNSVYTITNPTTANNGNYDVFVTSGCGNTTSGIATVALTIPAAFTTHPTSQTLCQGGNVSMMVAINSDANNPTYQWRYNGVAISQLDNQTANLSTLVINNAQPSQTGVYTCLVKTTCQPNGISSNGATLTVNPSTSITTQPTGVTVCEGTPASLSVTAQGTALVYQWRKNGTDIFGATNSTYNIPSVVVGDAGSYTVVVSGTCAPLSVTSNTVTFTVNQRAVVTGTPLPNQTVCQGVNIQFTTSASGTGVTYQWRKNTVAITGNTSAQTATLSLSNVAPSDNGTYDCLIIGTCSSNGVFTNGAVLTVNVPVAMQTTPQSQTVCQGTNVQFTSSVTGSVLGYQWRFNGQPITSNATATSPVFTLTNVSQSNAGTYDVQVNGLCNFITSAPATLIVNQPMFIVSQPTSQQGCAGTTISTSVEVIGSVLGYQWQKEGIDIPGMTSSVLTIQPASTTSAGNYRCVINSSSSCGTPQLISNTIVVTVGGAVSIVNQPQDKSVAFGSTVTVTVDAVGTGFGPNSQLFYRWYKGALQLSDDNRISGSTTGTLSIRGIQPNDVGSDYSVVILGQCGQVTSRQFAIVVPSANITTQPQGRTSCEGQSASFMVTAIPTVVGSTLSYQWYRGTTALTDGGAVNGATTSILTISSVLASDSGDYTVQIIVQPGGAKIISDVARLLVNKTPSIVTMPNNQDVCEGTKATLSVIAQGNGLTYIWKFNGSDIPGATATTLEIPAVTQTMAGAYTVTVTNSCGTINSSAATVTVSVKPTITTQPAVTTAVNVGGAFTLSVSASGTTPITYQWRKGGSNIPGATTATFTISAAKLTDGGDYTCLVTNGCGEVTTSTAKVSVGTVGVGDAELYGYTIFTAEPHPVSDVSTIRYTVAQQGIIRIILSDVNGRIITTLCNELQTEGNHSVVLQSNELNIASGTYQVTMITPQGYSTSKRIVIVR